MVMPNRAALVTDANIKRVIKAALEAAAPLIADQVVERAAEFADDAQDFTLSRRIRALKEPTP